MPRTIRFSENFARSRSKLALSVDARRAVGRCIQALSDAPELPTPADEKVSVPPVGQVRWIRRVTGANLWVHYVLRDGYVLLVRLTNSPPHR